MADNQKSNSFSDAQRKAEEILNSDDRTFEELSSDEIKQIMLDLKVYQIQLAQQNEDLIRAQQELANSRDRLSDLYNFAPVGYMTIDREGVIQGANLRLTELIDGGQQPVINQSFSIFLEGEKMKEEFYLYLRQLFESKKVEIVELMIRNKNGDDAYIKLEGLKIDQGGDAGPVARVTISDITARKYAEGKLKKAYDGLEEEVEERTKELSEANSELSMSEGRLRQIIDLSPDMVFIRDKEGTFLMVNQSLAEALGSTVEKVVGTKLSDYHFSKEELEKFLADDREVIATGKPKQVVYETFMDVLKDTRSLRTSKIPINMSGVKETAVLGFGVDITDRVRNEQLIQKVSDELRQANALLEKKNEELHSANEKLSQSQDQLRELNANKDRFFSIVARDLRTPFSHLLGYAEMLAYETPNMDAKEVQEVAKKIQRNLKGTLGIIDNLLDWSRVQTGRIVHRPESIYIDELMNKIIEHHMAPAAEKEITLKSEIEPNLFAHADPYMLDTVMKNLVLNAIKYSNVGGEVILKAKDSGDKVTVEVIDKGIGIREEDLARLFRIEQDVQLEGTAHEKGIGLGLILCKEFINKNGGEILIESEFGKGSVARFSLPKGKPING